MNVPNQLTVEVHKKLAEPSNRSWTSVANSFTATIEVGKRRGKRVRGPLLALLDAIIESKLMCKGHYLLSNFA